MFRHCLLLLAIGVDVSSFVPSSIANSKRLDILHELNRQQNDRATQLVVGSRINNNDDGGGDNNNDGHPVTRLATGVGTTVLAAILVLGPLLVSPDPTEARMTPDYSLPPTKTAEPKPMRPVRTSVAPNSLSDSSLLLSEDFNLSELRIQPKYLDLAGDLKEELKFRAQQGKEKALEKAREAQEKQQAATEARDARNKEYDDMFDQAEKDRNEYYSQRIISRDTYLQNLRDQEANQDRSEYNRAMGAFNPEGSPADELKYKLENNLQDEKNIRTALAENKQKDQDDRDTKVERTLLKIKLEKTQEEASKLRKDIALAESIDTIRLQRQAEIRVYQDRAVVREKEKEEAIENIRKIKQREAAAYEELRARKREEAKELKFANSQILFDRKFDDLERFDQRKKGIVPDTKQTTTKEDDAARVKRLANELNQLAVEDGATAATANVQQGQ